MFCDIQLHAKRTQNYDEQHERIQVMNLNIAGSCSLKYLSIPVNNHFFPIHHSTTSPFHIITYPTLKSVSYLCQCVLILCRY